MSSKLAQKQNTMVRGVSKDILWIHKFDVHWIAALRSLEECPLLLESGFKNVITKPVIGSRCSCCHLSSADARAYVRGQHLYCGQQ